MVPHRTCQPVVEARPDEIAEPRHEELVPRHVEHAASCCGASHALMSRRRLLSQRESS